MLVKFHHKFLLLVSGAVLFSFSGRHVRPPAVSPVPSDKLVEVINALKTGNAEQLSKYFDSYVDLTLPDKKAVSYSKRQAMMVLGDFFSTNPVRGFVIQTLGDGETANYCIGTLQTTGGAFQATLFIRKEGAGTLIKEIDLSYK